MIEFVSSSCDACIHVAVILHVGDDDITITSHLYRARMGATVGKDSHTEMRLQYFFTARNTKLPLEKVYIIFRICGTQKY